MSSSATQTAVNRFRFLAEAVVWRYRPQGLAVARGVRKKLLGDPFYCGLFTANRLPTEGLVLDLGCGRGIFLGLVGRAQSRGRAGGGKRGAGFRLVGIELDQTAAESAQAALGDKADIIHGDVRVAILPACRAAILQDVMLYLSPEEQDSLLERLVAALEPGGWLILRDADAGIFWLRTGVELVNGVASLFNRDQKRLYPRSGEDWQKRLESAGLRIENFPDKHIAGYGKILLLAHKDANGPLESGSL